MPKLNLKTQGDSPEDDNVIDHDETSEGNLPDGYILDFISGDRLKDSAKEQVRQRIAHALNAEYGIALNDMARDFAVSVDGKRKRVDIAIFHSGAAHEVANLSRVVVCRPEPKISAKTVRIRDYDQAEKDLAEVEAVMEAVESCQFGLWTNSLEFFYLQKKETRFEARFEPIGDWPPAGETLVDGNTPSRIRGRRADEDMLKIAFRRCHNFIHGNEGMPKDAAFWQFLYLIFCKIHDELNSRNEPRFWAGPKEQFTVDGRRAIRSRITPIFEDVKRKYSNIFRGNEEISLSDRALAFMVSELSKYDFARTEVDTKGAAYQEIVGDNLRGDRGQYFTPRKVVKLAIEMLAPKVGERILDPACGTGGFLVGTLAYMSVKFKAERPRPTDDTTEQFENLTTRLRRFAEESIFGADFDPFLIRASQMNMVMAGDGHGHLYHLNSLEFPLGHLDDLGRAQKEIPLQSFDVIMTNPPFGSDIPIIDDHILHQFELANRWERQDDGTFRNTNKWKSSVNPEILFIERCLQWLTPGGRMAIVLPNGILGNRDDEYIRAWILRNAWVLASIELPVEVFIVDANVNIQTSLLFLKKKTEEEILQEAIQAEPHKYPVFMAVAEKVGFDRRGNRIYKRLPNGEDDIQLRPVRVAINENGRVVEREILRPVKEEDNDLPDIREHFHKFLAENAPHYPHLQGLLEN